MVQEQAEAMLKLAIEQKMPYWATEGTMIRGWALAEQGQEEEGLAQMRQGFAAWRAMGNNVVAPYFLAWQIEVHERMGQIEEGQSALAEAFALVDKTREGFYVAELHRLKGELLLTQERKSQKPVLSIVEGANGKSQKSENTGPRPLTPDPQGEAEEYFLKAIEVAQKQQAKSLELRATVSLPRLWQQQALQQGAGSIEHGANSKESGVRSKEQEARTKLAEAYRMLSEVYNWFTEGFDTKDLQEAEALLTSLEDSI